MAKAGVIYNGRLSLFLGAAIVGNPPLAVGDVKVVKADSTVANIATLPSAVAGDTDVVGYTLSALEMAGAAGQTVTIKFEDQTAPAAWEPVTIDIPLTVVSIDDLAEPGDQMALLNDAITSAKFDEATAFPITLADGGPTAVTRIADLAAAQAAIQADVATRAAPGDEMDLAGAPNPIAIAAIQAGLARTGTDGDTLETLSDQMDGLMTLGPGATAYVYGPLRKADGTPIADADVWVTTDAPGANVVARSRTNALGQITFYLDSGVTYYFWAQKDGYSFPNPDAETV